MSKEIKHFYEFGPFRVDPNQRLLLRDNLPVPLQPKAFETLLVLVRNSETVVLKDDLMKSVWPDTFVEESNLTQNIFVLRKTLGDAAGEHRYIVTVPGRGYRFTEKVRLVPDQDDIVLQSRSITRVVVDEEILPDATPALTAGRRYSYSIAALVGIVVLGFAGYWAWRLFRIGSPASPGRVMLAVLPFQNLTGDPGQEYFADGLTEEMITQLGRLRPEQLGVIARTSVMGYKHSDKRLDQIGRELSVQYVLEGSFRRAGDRLRITAQLIQVTDQSHLWAQDYDRMPRDVLTVQDDVAVAVAQEIQHRLTPQQRTDLTRARTVDPKAYEAYLKGRYEWNKRTEASVRQSIQYFEQAIETDPTYALAYAGLADSYDILGTYEFVPPREAYPKAKEAAEKALELDDSLAEAHTALAFVHNVYDWDWRRAEREFKRALELNSNYATGHHWYGAFLINRGQFAEAEAELERAEHLDPLSLIIVAEAGEPYYFSREYDKAIAHYQKALQLDENFWAAHFFLGMAFEQKHDFTQAVSELQAAVKLSGGSPPCDCSVG